MPNQADRIVELQVGFSAVQARLDTVTRDLTEANAGLKAVASDELKRVDGELAALRQENAVLRQRLDDHLKRVELWDARRWGLVVSVALALLGSALAFASGLLLATLRTTPK